MEANNDGYLDEESSRELDGHRDDGIASMKVAVATTASSLAPPIPRPNNVLLEVPITHFRYFISIFGKICLSNFLEL
jgi:hypothetical protein